MTDNYKIYEPDASCFQISQEGYDYFITYGPDRLRRKTQLNSGIGDDVLLTKFYAFGDYEKEITPTGTRHLHYISGGDGLAAIYVKYNNAPDSLYFITTDHLGSLVGAINSTTGTIYRQNFDAWGRKRNPVNWSYSNIPDFPFDRGYTGHEHLKWFGLINMNGRMYDAAICRFLSPDPFVQMPDYTQNFNRYSYALNNPLIYSDPSGEFFIWDSWVVGFVHGFFSTSNDRFTAGWREANHTATNDFRIWGGLGQGNIKQIFSRFTWELPQTFFGFYASQTSNTFLDVQKVSYYDGATVVKHKSDSWGGFTIGSYINGDNSIKADPTNPLFQHEYGHYLQSQEAGWTYLSNYAIPSLINAMKTPNNYDGMRQHDAYGVEQDANIRGRAHFGEKVWDYDRNPIFDSGQNPDFDRDYGKYRTNQGLIHSSWWESVLIMALCIGL